MDGQQKDVKPESEKILDQIESAKLAAKEQDKTAPITQSAQTLPEKATQPTVESKAAPEGQAVSQSEAPDDKKTGKPEVDIREWANKKGIKDADTAFRSLREMEQKLSRVNAELKAKEDVPRGTQYPPSNFQPEPRYQPQPSYYPPQPSYPQFPDREKILEQEAKRFNMAPEDFERVLNLSNEISAMQTRRLEAQFNSRLSEIDKETRRNSELRELMQDPLFTDQSVQFEMHKVLEENPKAFTLEPSPYTYAFNEAQKRIARRYLQDGRGQSEEGSQLPKSPPKEGARGSQSFEKTSENEVLDSFKRAKTSDEQLKILTHLGAARTL